MAESPGRHDLAVRGLELLLADRGWTVIDTLLPYEKGEVDVLASYKGSPPVYFEVKSRHYPSNYRHARRQILRAVRASVASRGVYYAYCEEQSRYVCRLVSPRRELK